MSDKTANPHVAIRGDVYNDEQHEQRMNEITGKSPEQRKAEFDKVFNTFQHSIRGQLDHMRKRIYNLEMENNALKLQLHNLENKTENDNSNHE